MALKIPYQLEPQAVNGKLVDAKYITGGYMVVANLTERDHLPSGTIIVGSLVYVVSEGMSYRCESISGEGTEIERTWVEVDINIEPLTNEEIDEMWEEEPND